MALRRRRILLAVAVEIEPGVVDVFRESGGGRVVVSSNADAEMLMAAALSAIRAMRRVRHPEEPDDAFVSFISTPESSDGALSFYVDAKDLPSCPSIATELLEAVVVAMTEHAISDARIGLIQESPPIETTAVPPPTQPFGGLRDIATNLISKRRLADWYLRTLAPTTLTLTGIDSAALTELAPLTEPFAAGNVIEALTSTMRIVLERIGLRDGDAPGLVGVREALRRSVRRGEDWEELKGRNLDSNVVHAIGSAGRSGVVAREWVAFDMAGRNDTGRDVVDLVWSAAWCEVVETTWSRVRYAAHQSAQSATDLTPAESLFKPLADWHQEVAEWLALPLLAAASDPDASAWNRHVFPALASSDDWQAFTVGLADAGVGAWYEAFEAGLAAAFDAAVDKEFASTAVVSIVATITAKILELTRWLYVLEVRAHAYAAGADDEEADVSADERLDALVADSYRSLDAFIAQHAARPA